MNFTNSGFLIFTVFFFFLSSEIRCMEIRRFKRQSSTSGNGVDVQGFFSGLQNLLQGSQAAVDGLISLNENVVQPAIEDPTVQDFTRSAIENGPRIAVGAADLATRAGEGVMGLFNGFICGTVCPREDNATEILRCLTRNKCGNAALSTLSGRK